MSIGSSLIRHLRRNCNQPRPHSIRRKSCSRCVADKARCNLKRPSCSRCSTRQIICQYPASSPDSSDSPPESTSALQTADPSSMIEALLADPTSWDMLDTEAFLSLPSDSALVPTDSAGVYPPELMNEISSSLPLPRSTAESPAVALANHSMEFIFRILRSWPRMIAEGFQTPPFIHHSHVADTKSLPQPLAKCFTLVRTWQGQCKGAEDMVHQLVMTEVNGLLTKVRTPSDSTDLD